MALDLDNDLTGLTDEELEAMGKKKPKPPEGTAPPKETGEEAPKTIGAPIQPPSGSTQPQPPSVPTNPSPEPSTIGQPINPQPRAPRPAGERYQKLAEQGPPEYHGWKRIGDTIMGATKIGSAIEGAGGFGTVGYNEKLANAEEAAKGENQRIAEKGAEADTAAQVEQRHGIAALDKARAKALENPPAKVGLTGDEQTYHDLMTGGPNGGPQVNPQTGKPYTSLEVTKEIATAKNTKAPGHEHTTTVKRRIGKENHNILIDADTGDDIKDEGVVGEKEPTEPGNYLPVTNAKGDTVGWVDPKSGNYRPVSSIHGLSEGAGGAPGAPLPQKPTTQMRNVGAQAQAAVDGIPGVIDEINGLRDQLGPLEGRWNEFMQGTLGMDNPQFAGLRADLLMLSSAVALAHARGRLPENLREEFDRSLNAPKQTADNLISTINHVMPWMKRMSTQGINEPAGGGAPANTIHYKEGNDEYDIPTGKEQAFLKKHPNAKRQ